MVESNSRQGKHRELKNFRKMQGKHWEFENFKLESENQECVQRKKLLHDVDGFIFDAFYYQNTQGKLKLGRKSQGNFWEFCFLR